MYESVDYREWLRRMLVADGVLMTLMLIIPFVLLKIFPGQDAPVVAAAVLMPILGFFIRFIIGRRHILANACSPQMQAAQFVALALAVVPLIGVESLLTVFHLIPPPPGPPDLAEVAALVAVFGGIFCVYLSLMAFAMYPGRRLIPLWQTPPR